MRKLVLLLIVALVVAFIADYYGYISLPGMHQDSPTMLDSKKSLLHKSEEVLNSEDP